MLKTIWPHRPLLHCIVINKLHSKVQKTYLLTQHRQAF